jgi:hypothetical protein
MATDYRKGQDHDSTKANYIHCQDFLAGEQLIPLPDGRYRLHSISGNWPNITTALLSTLLFVCILLDSAPLSDTELGVSL